MGLTTLAIFCWDLPEALALITAGWAHTAHGMSQAADGSWC